MKQVKYNTIGKAVKEVSKLRHNEDNVRVAIYITEDDMLTADLQIEYLEETIVISSYEAEIEEYDFWDFYKLAVDKFSKDANKVKQQLEKLAFNVEVIDYTC